MDRRTFLRKSLAVAGAAAIVSTIGRSSAFAASPDIAGNLPGATPEADLPAAGATETLSPRPYGGGRYGRRRYGGRRHWGRRRYGRRHHWGRRRYWARYHGGRRCWLRPTPYGWIRRCVWW